MTMFNFEDWQLTIDALDDMLFNEDEDEDVDEVPAATTIREVKGILEDDTKNIRFIKFEMLGNNLIILYFVECSNLALRSLIHWKLDKLMKQTVDPLIKVELFEIGNPNYQAKISNFEKVKL